MSDLYPPEANKKFFICSQGTSKQALFSNQYQDFSGPKYKSGRWDKDEHERFIQACYEFKDDWQKIKEIIQTRSEAQIRSHAQKYLIKLSKKYSVKLLKRKFLSKRSKHLDSTIQTKKAKISISLMSKYDRNIFNLFRYYRREVDQREENGIILTNTSNDLAFTNTKESSMNQGNVTSLSITKESEFAIIGRVNGIDSQQNIILNTLINSTHNMNFNNLYANNEMYMQDYNRHLFSLPNFQLYNQIVVNEKIYWSMLSYLWGIYRDINIARGRGVNNMNL